MPLLVRLTQVRPPVIKQLTVSLGEIGGNQLVLHFRHGCKHSRWYDPVCRWKRAVHIHEPPYRIPNRGAVVGSRIARHKSPELRNKLPTRIVGPGAALSN